MNELGYIGCTTFYADLQGFYGEKILIMRGRDDRDREDYWSTLRADQRREKNKLV